jgi:hypothetical protein
MFKVMKLAGIKKKKV